MLLSSLYFGNPAQFPQKPPELQHHLSLLVFVSRAEDTFIWKERPDLNNRKTTTTQCSKGNKLLSNPINVKSVVGCVFDQIKSTKCTVFNSFFKKDHPNLIEKDF